jgi:acyl dehydratase
MAESLLTDELKGWIGRCVHYPAREEIGRASIRYFALAIGDENPLYLDDAYARAAGHPSLIAPPSFICETAQYAHGAPRENGYFAHEWDLPVTGCRTIRAGNDYEFIRPIVPSDRISVSYTLEDIVEKTSSKSGRTQLFLTSVARFFAEDGSIVAINRETLVLQPIEAAA